MGRGFEVQNVRHEWVLKNENGDLNVLTTPYYFWRQNGELIAKSSPNRSKEVSFLLAKKKQKK